MLTSKEVFAKRKEGHIAEAYSMALELVDSNPHDDWNIKALAYCIIDMLKQAVNTNDYMTAQNFASDLGVISISRVDQEVDEKYMAPIGFVHDAIYVLVKEKYVEWGAKTLKWYMESNPIKEWFGLDMSIPIIADVGFGWNAGETFEMGSLTLEDKYDFSKIDRDDDGKRLFKLPKQKIPKHNGRIKQPEYLQLTY